MDNTPSIKLKKPKPEDYYNIKDHNDNSDILDAQVKSLNDSKVSKTEIGTANGVAGLNAEGKLDQMPTASDVGAVPTSRTINNKALATDIVINANDIGAVDATRLNRPNGVAGIDADGKLIQVPTAAKLSEELLIISTTQPTVQAGKLWLKPIV